MWPVPWCRPRHICGVVTASICCRILDYRDSSGAFSARIYHLLLVVLRLIPKLYCRHIHVLLSITLYVLSVLRLTNSISMPCIIPLEWFQAQIGAWGQVQVWQCPRDLGKNQVGGVIQDLSNLHPVESELGVWTFVLWAPWSASRHHWGWVGGDSISPATETKVLGK